MRRTTAATLILLAVVVATIGAGQAGRRTPPTEIMRLPNRTVVVLDGLILVGACFVLTWTTALGAVVRAGGRHRPQRRAGRREP